MPVDSFLSDTLDAEKLHKTLPTGLYALRSVRGQQVLTTFLQASPIDSVQIMEVEPYLRLKIFSARLQPAQLSLRIHGKGFAFDSVTQTFVCPIRTRRFDYAAIEVICPDGALAMNLRAGERETATLFVQPDPSYQFPELALEDPYINCSNWGYLLFDKPMYKPGDTVRYKIYATNRRGKPLTDTLTLKLSQAARIVPLRIAPVRPGAYTGQYVLADSAGFRLDQAIRGEVWRGSKSTGLKKVIGYEAYKLREMQCTLPDPGVWYRGDSLVLAPTAKDPSGLPVPDAKVHLTVALQRVIDFPAAGKSVQVPDTVFTYRGPLREVVLPARLHPGLHCSWTVKAIFTNGANEQKTLTLNLMADTLKEESDLSRLQADVHTTTALKDSSVLTLPESVLRVVCLMPAHAAPGAEVEITVRVTDPQGRPVVGADVASLGVNAQFDTAASVLPPLPPMERAARTRFSARTARLSQENVERESSAALQPADLARFHLADSQFYRLSWPDSVTQFYLPLPVYQKGHGQLAPFVFHEGKREEVMLIFSGSYDTQWDKKLIYSAFSNGVYSFNFSAGKIPFLWVRTRNAEYVIRNAEVREGDKLLLSFNPEHLPANITRIPRPATLTLPEVNLLNASTLVLQLSQLDRISPTDSLFVWPEGRWADGRAMQVSENTVVISPVQQGSTWHVVRQGKWGRMLKVVPNRKFVLTPTETEIYQTSAYHMGMPFPHSIWQPIKAVARSLPRTHLTANHQLPDTEGGVIASTKGTYQSSHRLIALMRSGDTTNLWLAPQSHAYYGTWRLPAGWYRMVYEGGYVVDSVEIKAGYTLVHSPEGHLDTTLLARLREPMGAWKGQFLNTAIAFGDSSYTGLVLDSRTQQPVAGATVLLLIRKYQVAGTTTDSLGRFTLSKQMDIQSAEVLVVKEGFTPRKTRIQNRTVIPLNWQGIDCNDPFRFRPEYPFGANDKTETFEFRFPPYLRASQPLFGAAPDSRNIAYESNDYLVFRVVPLGKENAALANQPGGGQGKITGRVLDEKGQPIEFATVLVMQGDLVRNGAQTDVNGRFYIYPVEYGAYSLEIKFLAASQTIDDIVLRERSLFIEARMSPSDFTTEVVEIQVEGEAPVFSSNPTVVTKISGKEFRQLGSRNINTVASLTPGVYAADDRGAISIRGARKSSTVYYIDGVKVRGNASLPQASIKKMQVITGGTPGEFGDFTGGETAIFQLRTHFADCAWWQPLLVTDSLGEARFTVRLPDDITAWNGYALAMTAHKQAGIGKAVIRAHKPVEARLAVPDFLTTADTVLAIGRVLSHVPDSQAVTISYGQNGDKPASRTATVSGSLVQPFPVAPKPGDTLVKARFTVSMPGLGGDGEERNIPIYPVGVKEAVGTLLTLEGDTSLVFTPAPRKVTDSAYLSLSSDNLFPLLSQVEALRNYPYACNEQASSRLAGLLAGRTIDSVLHRPNGDSAAIAKLVKKLCDGQNPSGLWGWFPGMSDHAWLSALILRRVYAANPAAACIPKAQAALSNLLHTDTTLTQTVRIALLTALSKTGFAMDYHTAIDSIAVSATNLNVLANLGALKASLGKPIDRELNTLLPAARKTFSGGLFWGNYSWDWYGNGWETTLQVYQMLRHSGDSTGRIRQQIRRGVLEQTQAYTLNTLQAATLLATLLPDVVKGSRTLEPPVATIQVGDKSFTVSTFPYQTRIPAGVPLTITKTGISPVYLSYDQVFWNPAPNACDSLYAVTTWLEQGGKRVDALRAGATAELVVRVQAHYSSTYLALDVPIPAGCIYAAKPQYHQQTDCHREYNYHQTTIFMERLWTGEHMYRIPLEVRFGGSFVLNPARIHAMYMPHKQGFNAVKRVEVEAH